MQVPGPDGKASTGPPRDRGGAAGLVLGRELAELASTGGASQTRRRSLARARPALETGTTSGRHSSVNVCLFLCFFVTGGLTREADWSHDVVLIDYWVLRLLHTSLDPLGFRLLVRQASGATTSWTRSDRVLATIGVRDATRHGLFEAARVNTARSTAGKHPHLPTCEAKSFLADSSAPPGPVSACGWKRRDRPEFVAHATSGPGLMRLTTQGSNLGIR